MSALLFADISVISYTKKLDGLEFLQKDCNSDNQNFERTDVILLDESRGVTAVPEPESSALVAVGLAAVAVV